MTAEEVISHFNLEHLEGEGGFYRRIYLGEHVFPSRSLPLNYTGDRNAGSSILYLVTPGSFSSLHLLAGDEIWHFCMGDPAEQLLLYPDGEGELRILGPVYTEGHIPVSVVPGGVWQASRLLPGGRWALFGVSMPLAYDNEDFTAGDVDKLAEQYPDYRDIITAMAKN